VVVVLVVSQLQALKVFLDRLILAVVVAVVLAHLTAATADLVS
jgi:hypothetical protein